MRYIKLFESFEGQVYFPLINVKLFVHIGGIMWIEVTKDPSTKIFGEIPHINQTKSIIKFEQTNWDEWKPIMDPLGYNLNQDIKGYPFENKIDNKMIFIYDIGDSWYICSFYDLKNMKQSHYLIDDVPNVIKKINEFVL
jgi:hypothetical protein